MNFKEAYQKMLEGKKVKRPDWKGYWFIENDKVKIKFAGGEIKENRFTQQTIKNTAADDWEVCEEPKSKVWRPEYKEEYYCLVSTGEVECTSYSQNLRSDEDRVILGNCFETKEEAEHMVEKLKVIKELQDFALEHNEREIGKTIKDALENCYLTYHYIDKKVKIENCYNYKYLPFNLYFTSKEIAKQAIETIGEERIKKYYFDVEE